MYYDCHTHSCYSHDGHKTPEEACISAIQKGLWGIAFTEHADLRYDEINSCSKLITEEAVVVKNLKEKYKDKLKVLMGAEIADAYFCPDILKKTFSICDYDIILCSVHLIDYKNEIIEISTSDYTDTSVHEIHNILSAYYEEMRKDIYCLDCNVLSHFTYPLRYFNGRFGKNVSLDNHINLVEDILKIAIDKNVALEVNTARVTEDCPEFCPDTDIIKLYKSLGGTLFALGSDSHTKNTEANGFRQASDMLKSIGVTKCCYYENRKPFFYDI